jgi:hypothetical protein
MSGVADSSSLLAPCDRRSQAAFNFPNISASQVI